MESRSRKALVFGGSSGIGEAVARRFVDAGVEVGIVGRSADKLEQAGRRLGGGVRTFTASAADAGAVKGVFGEFGPFDHLVITVSGGEGAGPFATLDLARLRAGFEEKFWLHVQVAQASLGTLREAGSITFVSAASARAALPGTVGLSAINGAIEALVKPLAMELAPRRVNAVSPGVIDTPWWDAMPADQKRGFFEVAGAQLPVRRIGQPQEAAEAVFFAATNGFVTGSVVECDGGLHLGNHHG